MHTFSKRLISATAALLLVGAGCMQKAEELGNEAGNVAVAPLEQSAATLEAGRQAAAAAQAKLNWDAELASDDVTVALVLTDGQTAPPNAKLAPDFFGCSDRIAYVSEHRMAMTDSPLKDALTTLFSIKDNNYVGLHNSLNYSTLTVDDIRSSDGVTTEVYLKGDLSIGGTCAAPRVKEQISATIRRFRPNFKVFLNGSEAAFRCIGDESGTCS